MILAAGLGKRMRPLTDYLPKPLLPVVGKPLIEFHLERLMQIGIKECVINIAYLGDKIEQALGSGERWGMSIHYSREAEPLETAGAIGQALPLLGDAPFLLINGDVWTDYPLERLQGYTLAPHVLGRLVLVPNPEHNRCGDFAVKEQLLCQNDSGKAGCTFSGISLIRPALVAQYPNKRRAFPLREVFDAAIAQQCLEGEIYTGEWWDIGTPERLQDLERRLEGKGAV